MGTKVEKIGTTNFIMHDGNVYIDKLLSRSRMEAKERKLAIIHDRKYMRAQTTIMRIWRATLRNNAQKRMEKWQ